MAQRVDTIVIYPGEKRTMPANSWMIKSLELVNPALEETTPAQILENRTGKIELLDNITYNCLALVKALILKMQGIASTEQGKAEWSHIDFTQAGNWRVAIFDGAECNDVSVAEIPELAGDESLFKKPAPPALAAAIPAGQTPVFALPKGGYDDREGLYRRLVSKGTSVEIGK